MSQMRPFIVLSLLFLVDKGAAQAPFDVAVPGGRAAQRGGAVLVAPSEGLQPGLLAIEPFEVARPVLGAPYTADAVTEAAQTLANGNRIDHRTSAAIARDGRGRIRREHQAMFFGPLAAERLVPLITISDPSSGTHLTLDQERRVASRFRTRSFQGVSRGDFNIPVGPGFAGGHPGSGGADVRTEHLGARDIEGVRAEGTLTTTTIPAGKIGNQLSIDVVSERWYSPELQVVLLTRRSDPRFGETIYRLTNIVRAEPPAELFEVPQGFRIEEQSAPPR